MRPALCDSQQQVMLQPLRRTHRMVNPSLTSSITGVVALPSLCALGSRLCVRKGLCNGKLADLTAIFAMIAVPTRLDLFEFCPNTQNLLET